MDAIFSLKTLTEYTPLVKCITKIHEPFLECNRIAQAQGDIVMKVINENSEVGKLLKCCGIWTVRDCWLEAARQNCTEEETVVMQNIPTKIIPNLGTYCKEYLSD